MISLGKIERWAAAERFEELLGAVLANGRPWPLSLRLRLSQPEHARVAAAGLALQRTVELSYFPAPASLQLARVVAGELALDTQAGLAAQVLAAAGLVDLVEQCHAAGLPMARELELLIDDGLAAFGRRLFEAQASRAGAAGDGLVGDELDTATLLWQASIRPGLCRLVGQFVRAEALDRAANRMGLWKRPETAPLLALAVPAGRPIRMLASAA